MADTYTGSCEAARWLSLELRRNTAGTVGGRHCRRHFPFSWGRGLRREGTVRFWQKAGIQKKMNKEKVDFTDRKGMYTTFKELGCLEFGVQS